MGFYNTNVPNQLIGSISNPCEGLNEFVTATRIGDNQLSDSIDALPYRNSAIMMYSRPTLDALFADQTGFVLESIADIDSTNNEYVFALVAKKITGTYSQSGTTVTVTSTAHGLVATNYFYIVITDGTGVSGRYQVATDSANSFTYTAGTSLTTSGTCSMYRVNMNKHVLQPIGGSYSYDVNALGFPNANPETTMYCSCLFTTPAKNYVVFGCSSVKKLFYYEGGSVALDVDLPFYPKKLIYHANRVFAIDTVNSIWWSKAGSFKNSTDWYGSAMATSSVIEDSGYWTIEKERILSGICALGSNLYVFGNQNIYIFSGYDYDTFALQTAIADLGVDSAYNISYIAQTGKSIYFMSVYQSNNSAWLNAGEYQYDLYEFDGSNYPVIINRQVFESGQVTNGILGSIDIVKYLGMDHLTADEKYLYLYRKFHYSYSDYTTIVYVYDIKYRTWWKKSGFNDGHASLSDTFESLYIPMQNRNTSLAIVSDRTSGKYHIFNDVGVIGADTSFIITKAFSYLPTQKQTLTSVILQISAVAGTDLAYTMSISKSVDQDDFVIAKQVDHHIASGSIENIEIYLPISAVANASQYRLKIEIANGKCYLYNIERRYRVNGRSR